MTIVWVVTVMVGLLAVGAARAALSVRRHDRRSTAALDDVVGRVQALLAEVEESNEQVENQLRQLEMKLGLLPDTPPLGVAEDDFSARTWLMQRLRSAGPANDVRFEVLASFANLARQDRNFELLTKELVAASVLFPSHRAFDESRMTAQVPLGSESLLDAWRVDEWREELSLLRMREPRAREPEKPSAGVTIRFA